MEGSELLAAENGLSLDDDENNRLAPYHPIVFRDPTVACPCFPGLCRSKGVEAGPPTALLDVLPEADFRRLEETVLAMKPRVPAWALIAMIGGLSAGYAAVIVGATALPGLVRLAAIVPGVLVMLVGLAVFLVVSARERRKLPALEEAVERINADVRGRLGLQVLMRARDPSVGQKKAPGGTPVVADAWIELSSARHDVHHGALYVVPTGSDSLKWSSHFSFALASLTGEAYAAEPFAQGVASINEIAPPNVGWGILLGCCAMLVPMGLFVGAGALFPQYREALFWAVMPAMLAFTVLASWVSRRAYRRYVDRVRAAVQQANDLSDSHDFEWVCVSSFDAMERLRQLCVDEDPVVQRQGKALRIIAFAAMGFAYMMPMPVTPKIAIVSLRQPLPASDRVRLAALSIH